MRIFSKKLSVDQKFQIKIQREEETIKLELSRGEVESLFRELQNNLSVTLEGDVSFVTLGDYKLVNADTKQNDTQKR